MLRKFCRLFVLVCLATSVAVAHPARAATDPAGFIQGLGNKAIAILQNQSLDRAGRQHAFNQLFKEGFDVPTIARFVLGRYWRSATPQQQTDFVQTFGQYVVAVYSDRFSGYSGQLFKITGERQIDDSTATVASEIDPPNGGPAVHVTWTVAYEHGADKIIDVAVENLSMRITQQADFSSVIDQHGGSVQALIDMLKDKINGA